MSILYVEWRGFKMAGRKHECPTATTYEPAILFPAEEFVIRDFTTEPTEAMEHGLRQEQWCCQRPLLLTTPSLRIRVSNACG